MSGVEGQGQGYPYGGSELTTDQAMPSQKKMVLMGVKKNVAVPGKPRALRPHLL